MAIHQLVFIDTWQREGFVTSAVLVKLNPESFKIRIEEPVIVNNCL